MVPTVGLRELRSVVVVVTFEEDKGATGVSTTVVHEQMDMTATAPRNDIISVFIISGCWFFGLLLFVNRSGFTLACEANAHHGVFSYLEW